MSNFECYLNPVLAELYTRETVPGDGSCLFHCLQRGIPKLKLYTVDMVREEVCNLLKYTIKQLLKHQPSILFNTYHDSHPIEDGTYTMNGVLYHIDSDPSIDKYVKYMKKSSTYGTRIEILAAQIAFNTNICIYTMYGELEKSYEHLKTMILDPTKYTNECDVILYHCSYKQERTGNHFELLKPRIDKRPTKETTKNALQVARYKTIERRHLEDKASETATHALLAEDIRKLEEKTPSAYLNDDDTQMLIQQFILAGKTDDEIDKIMGWKYKYLKYKTKYLTLKKNTNLLYK